MFLHFINIFLCFVFFRFVHRDRQHQLKFLSSYCFKHCIKRFDEREVDEKDRKCISNCADKYMNSWDRLLQRYQTYVLPQTLNAKPSSFTLFKKLAKGWWMEKMEKLEGKMTSETDDTPVKEGEYR